MNPLLFFHGNRCVAVELEIYPYNNSVAGRHAIGVVCPHPSNCSVNNVTYAGFRYT